MLRLDPDPLPVDNSDPAFLGEALSLTLALVLVMVAAVGALLLATMGYRAVARRFRPRKSAAVPTTPS